jgi:hypothetical protein
MDRSKEASFFNLARFRGVFYRPDVIEQALGLADDELGAARADQESGKGGQKAEVLSMLPPVVTITSSRDGEPVESIDVPLRFSIRQESVLNETG